MKSQPRDRVFRRASRTYFRQKPRADRTAHLELQLKLPTKAVSRKKAQKTQKPSPDFPLAFRLVEPSSGLEALRTGSQLGEAGG